MIETRIFNADVGDDSVGNAGPDAIEQDLDNLYENKAWKEDVLTKNNITPYEPSSAYNPATKKYIDDYLADIATGVYDFTEELNNIENRVDDLELGIKYVGEYENEQALIMYILQNQLPEGIYTCSVNGDYLLGNIRYHVDILTCAIYGVYTITMLTLNLTTGILEERQELQLRDIVSKDYLNEEINNRYITGTYIGTVDPTNTITLTFEPSMVVIQDSTLPTSYTIINGFDCKDNETILGQITETGFTVSDVLNTDTTTYNYIAFK